MEEKSNINKYHNSKIYGLYLKDTNQIIYVGSTYNKLCKRYNGHKNDSKKNDLKIYKFINENGGIENVKIVLIENVKCENKEELIKIEQKYINEYQNEIHNSFYASRNRKEYYHDNKDLINEYGKKWRNKNKEHLKQYIKEWYNENKENVKQYEKEWYEQNKKRILEKQKKNYINNKDKFNEKINCDICNIEISKQYLTRHCKTFKHLNNINKQTENLINVCWLN